MTVRAKIAWWGWRRFAPNGSMATDIHTSMSTTHLSAREKRKAARRTRRLYRVLRLCRIIDPTFE